MPTFPSTELMDFFSNVPQSTSAIDPSTDPFAEAIASRFGSGPVLTARLPPPSPLSPPKPATPPTLEFTSISPAELTPLFDDPNVLILDIRPHAAYFTARLPRALSLSVPSTLLKRPLFGLDRITAMLSTSSARARFSAWNSASTIIVYDADAASIPPGSNILGLLRKFKTDSFSGHLAWLKGGFQAVWRENRALVIQDPPSPDLEEEDDLEDAPTSLRTRHLPMAAFFLASTTAKKPHHHVASNPFFDAVRQNQELSHGITDRIPLRLPLRVRRRINDLPFRWLQDIARRAAPLPRHPSDDDSSESELDDPDESSIDEGAESLAMAFYRIELAEQRRLMSVMEHHSRETVSQPTGFPFSITAGVEKGAKNRYRHIWPFEHARVRLHQKDLPSDDYVNASYVQPLGTRRRYIATQGPLPATFTDFWTLCWEQNVHVIVMLTREIEGSSVKCGNYWADGMYGPLRLRLLSISGALPETTTSSTGGFFQLRSPPTRNAQHADANSGTITRTFSLQHTGFPQAPPRIVTHLQYLDWPDMNVPEDPRGVLGLVKAVENARRNAENSPAASPGAADDPRTGVGMRGRGRNRPVLMHCSAGVGRTGGFIAVDALLDGIRRELTKADEDMDVDEEEGVERLRGGEASSAAISLIDAKKPQPSSDEGFPDTGVVMLHTRGPAVHVPLVPVDADADATSRSATNSNEASAPISAPGSSPEISSSGSDQSSNEPSPAPPAAAATRRWAQAVHEQTHPHSSCVRTHAHTGSVSSASPSSSEVESLVGGAAGTRSSLATTVSTRSGSSVPSTRAERVKGGSGSAAGSAGGGEVRTRTSSAPVSAVAATAASSSMVLSHAASHPGAVAVQAAGSSIRPSSPPDDDAALSSLATAHNAASSTANDPGANPTSSHVVDYREPRQLHEDRSPPALSSFEDPIWQMVQDMREQRMSLCQSLRQYVFVHAAVVEGALEIVDELKGRAAGGVGCRHDATATATGGAVRSGSGASSSGGSSSPSKGKRGASPTELLKEDKRGDLSLSKRPSIKRKVQGSEIATFLPPPLPASEQSSSSLS